MPSFKRAYDILIHVLLLGALAAVGILLMENGRLRSISGGRNVLPGLLPGDSIKNFDVSPLKDSPPIDTAARRQLFFFFKADCPVCRGTVPYWNSIAERMASAHIPVHGITFDEEPKAANYAAVGKLRFPVSVLRHGQSFALANHMYSVPVTLVVSHGLVIRNIWPGPVDSALAVSIIREGMQ